MSLLDEVLEAHGGEARWRAARTIRARVRSGGLLLATRAPRRLVSEYWVTVRLDRPWTRIEPTASPERAVFDDGRVRIENRAGEATGARDDPRSRFSGLAGLRRNLRWDALDTAYFAGYAMWNYLATPLLLTRDEVEVREGEPYRPPGGGTWRRLEARFGPGLDTHSERQTFYAGDDGLLHRHDYTAEVVGGWAKAAHALAEHHDFDGLVLPTRRRVTPRGPGNRALPGPAIVWIELDRVEVAKG